MKNFSNYFNQNVTDLDIRVTVPFGVAEKTGWEFGDVVSEVSTVSGETVEQVRSRLASDWRVTVSIEGKKESPYTRFYFQSWENGNWENGGFEPTGDDEQTIKDVINWLTAGVVIGVDDYSFEATNNTYQPAFGQFKTQN